MAKREMISPPNNSFKHREKKVEEGRPDPPKMVPGAVTESKKSLGRKFAETFLSEDSSTVTSYIFSDVIVPMIKDMIYGAINQGTETLLWGRGSSSYYKKSSKNYGTASYQGYYTGGKSKSSSEGPTRNVNEILFDNRRAACDVLDEMKAVIEQYDNLSILDYHDIVEKITGFCPSSTWADDKYGWTDLSGVKVEIARGGKYIIPLPKAVPLD